MAFLAPDLRWPDKLGLDSNAMIESIKPQLPAPFSDLSPDLLFSILVSCSVIVIITLTTTALQLRHPKATVSAVGGGGSTFTRRRLKANDQPVVLFAGPSGTGKTSLFSALAFQSVPSVHPSQRESESKVKIAPPPSKTGELLTERTVTLIDTPGHPRIKDRIVAENVKQTDVVVFCIDAKEALRGGAGLGAAKEGSLTEAVDHLHELLLTLAKSRRNLRKSAPPPVLVVLFTRADLSPHTANISLSSLSSDESKRRSFLLARARTAIEVELGRRRAGMGFGAKRTTKVGGMAKVTGGQGSTSLWTNIKRIFSGDADASGGVEEDEEDEELIDYVDWDVLDRSMNNASQKGGLGMSAGTSLEKLDADVVEDGKALFAFVSVGKERGWDEQTVEGVDELRRILLTA